MSEPTRAADQGSKRKKGASALECGVLLGSVAVVAILGTATLGGKVQEIFGCFPSSC